MNCEELVPNLSEYLDDALPAADREACDGHLQVCPVCRAELSGLRSIVRGMQAMARPAAPSALASAISDAIYIESAAIKRQPRLRTSELIKLWIQPRLMPYAVGTLASGLLFVVMFAALRSSLTGFHNWDRANRTVAMRFQVTSGGYDLNQPLTAENFAAGRSNFSPESPSLNPSGALAALTLVPARSNGDDDMVVVADVFSNGIASLADVVTPPRDPRMLDDFQEALRKDAAFVPASFDRRPQTMRVVLVVQKVAVSGRDD